MKCPSCKRPTATVEGELLCHYHLRIFNKSGKQLEAPNKKSISQAARDRKYNLQAAAYKVKNPLCMAKLIGCQKHTEDIHHKIGRIGDNLFDEKQWLPCCRSCHNQIEANPLFAKALGLSSSRLSKTEL